MLAVLKSFRAILLIAAIAVAVAGCGPGYSGPGPGGAEATQAGGEIRGQVVEVIPRIDSAVISVGRDQGVEIGDVFDIYRDGRKVARLPVTALFDTQCGGKVSSARDAVTAGDLAVLRVSDNRPTAHKDGSGQALPATVVVDGNLQTAVIAVREKEQTLVLNAGSANGLKPGQELLVYDDDLYLGRVRLTLVRERISGAVLIEQREKITRGCRALLVKAASRELPPSRVSNREIIKELEAKIRDPKTSPANREAARKVLEKMNSGR